MFMVVVVQRTVASLRGTAALTDPLRGTVTLVLLGTVTVRETTVSIALVVLVVQGTVAPGQRTRSRSKSAVCLTPVSTTLEYLQVQ